MMASLVRRLVVGMLVRAGVRRVAVRSVDIAASKLQQQLPEPVVRVANALPGDLMRIGGSAIVATGAARTAALTTKRATTNLKHATEAVGSSANVVRSLPRRARARRDDLRAELAAETESARRSFASDFQRSLRGADAGLDALLDRRVAANEPLPIVPGPIPPGRRRFVPQIGPAPVNRAQRTYQKPINAWDRPLRRR